MICHIRGQIMPTFDLIVIGGSASGLCAAIQAARSHRDFSIAVLEQMPKLGKKILATGNGRCNLSNTSAGEHDYHNFAFASPALQKYDVEETLSFFRSLGLLTVTDAEGRIYPMSNTASSVLDALRFEIDRLGIKVYCGHSAKSVLVNDKGLFKISCQKSDTDEKREFEAHRLIIATGGKAAPVHGSDGSGYVLLKQLGHGIMPPFPALVQFRSDSGFIRALKGVRVNAKIAIRLPGGKPSFSSQGEILFTQYGLSGIAAMEVSRPVSEHFAAGNKEGCFAVLDFAPRMSEGELTEYLFERCQNNPSLPAENLLAGILPGALGRAICKGLKLYNSKPNCGNLTESDIKLLNRRIKAMDFDLQGVQGFNNAQVTAGGADINEFNPVTMQSCKVKSLYVCGEVLDVDGNCGGYNLQWAWSSGLLAGELL